MGGSAVTCRFFGATNGIKRFEGKGDNRTYSSEVQAAIVMCGPMSLLLPHIVERVEKAAGKPEGDAIIDFMGGALPGQKTGIYVEASPLTHVNKKHLLCYLLMESSTAEKDTRNFGHNG